MKILITGANGMLAQAVKAALAKHELILTDANELDITDFNAVADFMEAEQPEVLINCAAYTNVDKAEEQEEIAFKVNATGPENLAKACEAHSATLVHISTDYVFGGKKGADENADDFSEDDTKNPETAYGRTKLAGEEGIIKNCTQYYIFRTAWLYGEGNNFVRTMLKAVEGRDEVSVVNDQHGSPTYAEDLAAIVKQAVEKRIPYGVYHATNMGYTTWAEFTEKIYELAGVSCKVRGISSEEYEAQAKARAAENGVEYKVAPRPKNSKMSKEKLLAAGFEIPSWEDGLKRYLEKEAQNA